MPGKGTDNYGSDNASITNNEAHHTDNAMKNHRTLVYWIMLAVLVLLNVADNVLVVVLFDEFTEVYAQFVNQGTAFVYIIISSVILFVRWLPCGRHLRCFWDKPKHEQIVEDRQRETGTSLRKAPWYLLVGIGLFNGSANFLMAISQPHTPGLTQTLLYNLGIPLVMVLSAIFLHQCPTPIAIVGAVLVVGGSCISALREVFQPDPAASPVVILWGSVVMFAIAQIFLSGEKVWEEASFSKFGSLDPMLMFWYTLVTQFLLGWALYPVQTIPDFGNITLSDIPVSLLRHCEEYFDGHTNFTDIYNCNCIAQMVIVNGTLCSLGQPVPTSNTSEVCTEANSLIFFVYAAQQCGEECHSISWFAHMILGL